MVKNKLITINENTFMITVTIATTENCNIANEINKSVEKLFSDSPQPAIEETKPLTCQTITSDAEKYEDYVRNYFNDNFHPLKYLYFRQKDLMKLLGVSRTTIDK